MLQIKTFSFNPFGERCVLMWDGTGEGVVVDPGCYDDREAAALEDEIRKEGVAVKAVWLTHAHWDHVCGMERVLKQHPVPVMMSPLEKETLASNGDMAGRFGFRLAPMEFKTTDIKDGDTLRFGDSSFAVIGTPGHTPGGVCFHDAADSVLLSGDTLFAGSIGRSDLPGGDYDKLIVSVMDKIMGLPGDTDVIPGHGPVTSISHERTHNPFLQPFNEREELFPEEFGGEDKI